jgi:hypothetical protein
MADFSKLVDKNFKVKNFPDQSGGKLRFTIRDCEAQEVGASKESLPVLRFVEDTRGVVLSGAKYNKLAEAFGSRETDDWKGKQVDVYIDWDVEYRGHQGGLKVVAAPEE